MESPFSNPEAVEDLQGRIARIERLLYSDPALADAEAVALLAAVPGQPRALLLQGIARRLMGNPASAIEILAPLCQTWPDASAHLQLGLAQREAGRNEAAVETMRRAVAFNPEFNDAWRALAELLTAMGDTEGADAAFAGYLRYSQRDPRLLEPAAALRENRAGEAESLLRRHLQRHPMDIAALCMLADVAAQHDRLNDAETLLKRCLELAPSYQSARHNHAVVLLRRNRLPEALQDSDRLLVDEPKNRDVRKLRAAILMRLGEYREAINLYEGLLGEHPDQPKIWTSLGHALRMVGQRERCIEAYRKAIELAPHYGEAYWNLANLKTFQTTESELESMRGQIAKLDLPDEDRVHFHFAIGKALENRGEFADSFKQYAEGNRLRRRSVRYDSEEISALVRRSISLFNPAFFAERAGHGASAADPVFIVGLPRAGSTLVEQILASHSAVEGTMELPYIPDIAKSLGGREAGSADTDYPEVLAALEPKALREHGQSYIEQARVHRKQGAPFFIDKMPNNFAHLGLIHLMLPNARIIDVRRHPLACGLSLFKHLFGRGQNFCYSLEDIGRYYRDYVALMAHCDAVLPGRVHRVIYESLVRDTETEVRRLLEYCGLPFEEACLKFYENERAVSTASSEQVRSPVYCEAVDHWRHYEPWLHPLKAVLGELVDAYPDVPQ